MARACRVRVDPQTTLLSIPQDDVKTAFMMFDLDDSGTLDREEFKEVLAVRSAASCRGSVFRSITPYFSYGELRFARPALHGFNNRYLKDPQIVVAKLEIERSIRYAASKC